MVIADENISEENIRINYLSLFLLRHVTERLILSLPLPGFS